MWCRMKEGQKDVFYMAADSLDAASSAPFVERLVQRDYEVSMHKYTPVTVLHVTVLHVTVLHMWVTGLHVTLICGLLGYMSLYYMLLYYICGLYELALKFCSMLHTACFIMPCCMKQEFSMWL